QFVKNKQVTAKSLWEFIHQNFNFPENLAQETDEFIHLFEKAKKEKDQVKEYLNNENLSIEHDELTKLKHLLKEEKLDVVRLIELLSTTNFTSKKALTESEKLWKGHLLTEILESTTNNNLLLHLSAKDEKKLKSLLENAEHKATDVWKLIWKNINHQHLEQVAKKEAVLNEELKKLVKDNFDSSDVTEMNKLSKIFIILHKQNLLYGLLDFIDGNKIENLKNTKTTSSLKWSKSLNRNNSLVFLWKKNQKGLNKVVNHILGKKYKFTKNKTKSSFIAERLIYLLNYQLLDNKEKLNQQTTDKKILFDQEKINNLFENIEDLKNFLKANQSNHKALVLLASLSLKPEKNKQIKTIFNTINQDIIKAEKLLNKLYDEGVFVRINDSVIKPLIRAEILMHSFVYNKNQFKPYVFLYNFIEKLNSSNYVELKTLNLYLKTQIKITGIEEKLNRILLEFVTFRHQIALDKNISKEYFFSDLFFHILKYNSVPSWSVYKNYEIADAISFMESKIKSNSTEFLLSVFSDNKIQPRLINLFKTKNIDNQVQLLQVLEGKKKLSVKLFKALLPLSISSNIRVESIFSAIINAKPWLDDSRLSVLEKVVAKLSDEAKVNREEIIDQITKEDIDLFTTVYTHKKEWTSNEMDMFIEYFIVNGKFPKGYKTRSIITKKEVKVFLNKNILVLGKYIEFSKNDFNFFKNLLSLTNLNKVKTEIMNNLFINTLLKQKVYQLLKNSIDSSTSSEQSKKASYYILNRFFTAKANLKISELKILAFEIQNLLPKKIANELASLINNEMTSFRTNPSQKVLSQFQIDQFFILKNELSTSNTSKLASENSLDLLIYYLSFGAIPDHEEIKSVKELFKLTTKLNAYNLTRWKIFIHSIGHSKENIKLLLHLYPIHKHQELLKLIHPDLHHSLQLLEDVMLSLNKTSLHTIIEKHLKGQKIQTSMSAWSKALVIINNPIEIIREVIKLLKIEKLPTNELFKIQNQLELVDIEENSKNGKEKNIINELKNSIKEQVKQAKEFQKQNTNQHNKISEEIKKGAVIIIENAGLIITWPFLATLFAKLKLTDKNKFIDDYAQQKAVLLSQYIVNFKSDFNEESLALNKIICGMDVMGFVDTTIELTEHDKETCNFLLNAIIQNWEKLNKTSIKTLQETFLQRSGELEYKEKDYKLTVEIKAFDLLLKTIPWNIGMIQTSFMKNRILVNWNY
ncbi:contractile injection system tape measure protein, partial [Psychroflexus salis]|uniref:contractile injection system tape measure protein n=1 Tax=Psychroflexus salis TaxID=1526574 RepID=UPI001E33110D